MHVDLTGTWLYCNRYLLSMVLLSYVDGSMSGFDQHVVGKFDSGSGCVLISRISCH